jgi:site-specific DNA recombinase
MVTGEIKKARYIYYRCAGYRGPCGLPYFREEVLADRLGQILRNIHIPDEILSQLERSLLSDKTHQEAQRREQEARLQQRLAAVRRRMDQAYMDKLDGKISEEFWLRKVAEWQQEEQQVLLAMQGLEQAGPERVLDKVRILELANKAYFLCLRQTPTEKAKLLRIVLSNCALDTVSVYPTYRKPFDSILERAKK